MAILEHLKQKFVELVEENQLHKMAVMVCVGSLTPDEVIGRPRRQDFALLKGKEVIVEAEIDGSFGQAFTDEPKAFNGTIKDVLNLSLENSGNRAIFIAALNALTCHLGIVKGTRHCKDEEFEICGKEMAAAIYTKYGDVKVGMIGFQPAILRGLVKEFGPRHVRCTDLNSENIGGVKFGVEIWDGKTETTNIVQWCDLLLVTGSTIVNNSFSEIRKAAEPLGKPMMVFGVTIAGAAALLGLERLCPFAS